MYRLVALLPLFALACARAPVREPSNEDRLARAFSEPAGPIPEPLTFETVHAERSRSEMSAGERSRTGSDDGVTQHSATRAWVPWVYPIVLPTQRLPPVRSRVLTNPGGMPGGSTPGLLP